MTIVSSTATSTTARTAVPLPLTTVHPNSRCQAVWTSRSLLGGFQTFTIALVTLFMATRRRDEVCRVCERTGRHRGVVSHGRLSSGNGIDQLATVPGRYARDRIPVPLVGESIIVDIVAGVRRAHIARCKSCHTAIPAWCCRPRGSAVGLASGSDLPVPQFILGSTEGFVSLELV